MIKKFLKHKMVIGAIIMAVFYQIVFTVVWMTGYSAVPNNLNNLRIGIVNEDPGFEDTLDGLKNELPFKNIEFETIDEAKLELETREIEMIMQVPSGFMTDIQQIDNHAQMTYIINESNPTMSVSTMDKISESVTQNLNNQVSAQITKGTFVSMQIPEEQAEGMTSAINTRVVADVNHINESGNMASQMIPMLFGIIAFVSSMIFSMNMQKGVDEVFENRWRGFFTGKGFQALCALAIPLITTVFLFICAPPLKVGFLQMWMFLSLSVFVCMQLSQVFILLFGDMGMLFNVALIVVQTINCGFTIPSVSLGTFYEKLAHATPMTYIVTENRNLLFGGSNHWEQIYPLLIIGIVSIAVSIVINKFRRNQEKQLVC